MQIKNHPIKKKKNDPSIRLLKVYYKFRMNLFNTKRVPEIRLCGNWLEDLGFKEGDDIVVSLEKRRIEICVIPEEDQIMSSILAMDIK